MVRPNRLKQTVKEGKVAKGLIVLLPHPNVIEILGSVGWDYFMLEMEHGSFGIETAKICFLAADAAGITPMAKVPAGDPFAIMEVLDAGCQGIVAPHIATVEDARGVVRACRHQPEGDRSVCTGARSAGHAFFNNPPDYPQQADREVMIVLLVEEEEGVKNLAEIASVPGVDAVCVGPGDLASSIGFPGQIRHPKVAEAMVDVVKLCKEKGIVPGALPVDLEQATLLVREGARLLLYGAEEQLLYHILRRTGRNLDEAVSKGLAEAGSD